MARPLSGDDAHVIIDAFYDLSVKLGRANAGHRMVDSAETRHARLVFDHFRDETVSKIREIINEHMEEYE